MRSRPPIFLSTAASGRRFHTPDVDLALCNIFYPTSDLLLSEMPNKLASQDAITEDCFQWMWTHLPDHLFLSIFQYLPPKTVLDVSQVTTWHIIAQKLTKRMVCLSTDYNNY